MHCLQRAGLVGVRKFPFLEVTPTISSLGGFVNDRKRLFPPGNAVVLFCCKRSVASFWAVVRAWVNGDADVGMMPARLPQIPFVIELMGARGSGPAVETYRPTYSGV